MNADLLMQLVNDILDMSKIEAGTLEFVQTTVDVNQLLSDLQQLFQMRVDDAGENIQIIAESSRSSCMIQTDRNRVAQVLFKLCRATPLSSPIKVASASAMKLEIPSFTFMSRIPEPEFQQRNYRMYSSAS